jgi:ABC-2 type transport system permease protein
MNELALKRAELVQANLWRINLVGFWTIVRKESRRVVRIWIQTIVPPAITMTLYFIIFGSLVGSRIGSMDGVPYMTFIAPGLIMMAVITNSYANVVSSFFGAKFGKHVEELIVSPLPSWLIVAGYASGGLVRGIVVGAVVTAVALFFTQLHVHDWFVIVSSVVLSSLVFSLGGFINAVFAKNFDQISWFPTFILTPLTYLGGVFYSVSLLPGWAEKLSHANPILYMMNAFRFGFLGVSDVDVGFAYTIMIGFAIALYALAVYLLQRGTGIRE